MLRWLRTASLVLLLPVMHVLAQEEDAGPVVEPAAPVLSPFEIDAPVDDADIPAACDATVDETVVVGLNKTLDAFWGYRFAESATEWIVGDGNQFGMFSFGTNHYQKIGPQSGVGVGAAFHFLAGPQQTDMPPRVFDFSVSYQMRETLGAFRYDIAAGVRAASDFEGSSREGIRFPCHAVGYWVLSDTVELVFGADYLDRADLHVLPVGGLILRPDADIRLDLVFPSPRVTLQLTETDRLFLNGGIGGGSWAVERVSEADDLVSYYDLRVGIGLERLSSGGSWQALEVAYLFDRQLEFTSGVGDYHPNATVMIRSVADY